MSSPDRASPASGGIDRRGVLRGALALASSTVAGSVRASALPAALRGAGGCVLLVRHAQTEPGVGDPPGMRLDDCATQRNLSAQGRVQAQRLGTLLRDAGVSVGPVRSSRWCRCQDTARLAFERVEPWPALDSFFDDRTTESARTAELRRWALAFEGPGHAVLVTHQVNVTALTGEWVGMGEALVLRPERGALRILGRFEA